MFVLPKKAREMEKNENEKVNILLQNALFISTATKIESNGFKSTFIFVKAFLTKNVPFMWLDETLYSLGRKSWVGGPSIQKSGYEVS